MFFNLTTSASESVYGPNPTLDSSGSPEPLGPALPATAQTPFTAWEIEFNYTNPSAPASLEFGGNIYTASAATLSSSNLNEFVYYNGNLYAPTGWASPTVSAPEIDSTSAIAGLTLLVGCLAVLRGRRTLHISG
jgi:hypothetical protein